MHASPTSSSRTGAPWSAQLLILVSILAPIVTAQNSHERRIQYTGITVLNSVTDFCLFGLQTPGQTIAQVQAAGNAFKSYCLLPIGAALMPVGTIQSAHYIETPNYVQVSGIADLTKINIAANDPGGEIQPYNAMLQINQVITTEFHVFVGTGGKFCFRGCKNAPDAAQWCNKAFDLEDCLWNDPGNYGPGFDQCLADSAVSPPGIYVSSGQTSTYVQGVGPLPSPHAAGASSQCSTVANLDYAITSSTSIVGMTGSSTSGTVPRATPSPDAPATVVSLSTAIAISNGTATSSSPSSSSNSTLVSSKAISSLPGASTAQGIAAATSAVVSSAPGSGSRGLVAPFLAFVGFIVGLIV